MLFQQTLSWFRKKQTMKSNNNDSLLAKIKLYKVRLIHFFYNIDAACALSSSIELQLNTLDVSV